MNTGTGSGSTTQKTRRRHTNTTWRPTARMSTMTTLRPILPARTLTQRNGLICLPTPVPNTLFPPPVRSPPPPHNSPMTNSLQSTTTASPCLTFPRPSAGARRCTTGPSATFSGSCSRRRGSTSLACAAARTLACPSGTTPTTSTGAASRVGRRRIHTRARCWTTRATSTWPTLWRMCRRRRWRRWRTHTTRRFCGATLAGRTSRRT